MLANGKSIMQNQNRCFTKSFFTDEDIFIVVGYKKEEIMDSFPDFVFIYNERFEVTNTAKSLLKAISRIKNEDILWINGDVFCEEKVVSKVVNSKQTCMAC